jgi:hypothetical protein
MASYKLSGVELSTLGVYVEKVDGIFQVPDIKSELKTDWPDRHGEQVDLTAPRYKSRDIKIKCYMKASSRIDFLMKVNQFIASYLIGPRLKQLLIIYENTKPLVFMIYLQKGLDISRETIWNDTKMTGTFTLTLREPEPWKRLLKFTAVTGAMQAQLAFDSNKLVTVYWGDGSYTVTSQTSNNLTHDYSAAGTYYIAVVGVVEELTNQVTNCEQIWSIQ